MRRKAKQTRKRWQRNFTQPAQGRAGIGFFFIRAGKLGQYADSDWREIKLPLLASKKLPVAADYFATIDFCLQSAPYTVHPL